MPNTATTGAARDHARSQAAMIVARPATPDGVEERHVTWAEIVPGGRYTTMLLARGTRLRLRDAQGGACAQFFAWRADRRDECLNTADTVKVPWQAYLGAGHPLLSARGRVLATVVADTSGRHDALTGASTLAGNTAKYGAGEPESSSPAGRELLALAAAKHGLTRLDVGAPVSFFFGVDVGADGTLHPTGHVGPDVAVDLVLHVPLIVAIANCAHPLDPSPDYQVSPLEVLAWHSGDALSTLYATLDDTEPEYQRAVDNTESDWAAGQPAPHSAPARTEGQYR